MTNEYDIEYYLKFGHHNDNIGLILRHYSLIKSKRNILVVPCGTGQIVNWCLSNGINCDGYDISEFVIKISQEHLKNNMFVKDIRSMNSPLHKYELIICADLLEHFDEQDINTSIEKIKKCLAYNGCAIIRVGTNAMDCFDDDPTHIIKKPQSWWIDLFKNHDLELKYGPTEIGEFVVENNYDDSEMQIEYRKCLFRKNPHNAVNIKSKLNVENLKEIILVDAFGKKLTIYPRLDNLIQIDNAPKIYVTKQQAKSIDLFFHNEYIFIYDANSKDCLCKIQNELQYPLQVECRGNYEIYDNEDYHKVEATCNGEININANVSIKTFYDGDIFLICNENEEPFFYLGIREKYDLWYGFHFNPDIWSNNKIKTLQNANFIAEIKIKKGESLCMNIDGEPHNVDISQCDLATPEKDTVSNYCIIYGKTNSKSLNINSSDFDIEFDIKEE